MGTLEDRVKECSKSKKNTRTCFVTFYEARRLRPLCPYMGAHGGLIYQCGAPIIGVICTKKYHT